MTSWSRTSPLMEAAKAEQLLVVSFLLTRFWPVLVFLLLKTPSPDYLQAGCGDEQARLVGKDKLAPGSSSRAGELITRR